MSGESNAPPTPACILGEEYITLEIALIGGLAHLNGVPLSYLFRAQFVSLISRLQGMQLSATTFQGLITSPFRSCVSRGINRALWKQEWVKFVEPLVIFTDLPETPEKSFLR
jgi:hypothetical protein